MDNLAFTTRREPRGSSISAIRNGCCNVAHFCFVTRES